MLQDWKEVTNVTWLEWQVLVHEYLLIRKDSFCLLSMLLSAFMLSSFVLGLSLSLGLYNSGDVLLHQYGIVIENELLAVT